MKRLFRTRDSRRLWAATIPVVILLALVSSATLIAREMSVEVREAHVRARPSRLASIKSTLPYGARVTILEEKDPWFKVRSEEKGLEGWAHKTALTKNEIILKAGMKDVATSATSDEVALAGKGFNAQVEAAYRSRHADIAYTWVDRMEKIVVSPEEMAAFLKEGKVAPSAGGVR